MFPSLLHVKVTLTVAYITQIRTYTQQQTMRNTKLKFLYKINKDEFILKVQFSQMKTVCLNTFR